MSVVMVLKHERPVTVPRATESGTYAVASTASPLT